MAQSFETLSQLLEQSAGKFKDNDLFGTKQPDGSWTWLSYGDFAQLVARLTSTCPCAAGCVLAHLVQFGRIDILQAITLSVQAKGITVGDRDRGRIRTRADRENGERGKKVSQHFARNCASYRASASFDEIAAFWPSAVTTAR